MPRRRPRHARGVPPRRPRPAPSSARRRRWCPPGRSSPRPTSCCPRPTPPPATSTCARWRRSGNAAARTSTGRWPRWSGRSAWICPIRRVRADLRRIATEQPDQAEPLGRGLRHLPARGRRRQPRRGRQPAPRGGPLPRGAGAAQAGRGLLPGHPAAEARGRGGAGPPGDACCARRSAGPSWRRCWTSAPPARWRRCPRAPCAGSARWSWPSCTTTAWSAPTRPSTPTNVSSAASTRTARGTDDPQVVRENGDALEALARLYAKVGMWPKAVEALQRQIELGPEPERLRTLKLRLAEISERELGQVDQAVGGAGVDPGELAPRSRGAGGAGSPAGRAGALRGRCRRSSPAGWSWPPSGEKRALIRRRANILEEKLGNADAAAACPADAGGRGGARRGDVGGAAAQPGPRRPGPRGAAGAGAEDRVSTPPTGRRRPRWRPCTWRWRRCGWIAWTTSAGARDVDRGGAEAAARQRRGAGGAGPPAPAGERLPGLRSQPRRGRRRRWARARPRPRPGWTPARVYRDQLADAAAGAVQLREGAGRRSRTAPVPCGRWPRCWRPRVEAADARALYERQLALVEDPAAKAAVLTDLARTLLVEKPGEVNLAVARLDEALDLVPDHLPAVISMADIFYREQQWVEAERRLLQAIRRLKGQPAEMAQLYHRLGEVYDKLGRLDEGYRQLQEADRMVPGQLLIRLALGENRFQAKKWREAVQLPGGPERSPRRPQVPDGGGRGAGPRRLGRGAPEAPGARGGPVPGGPALDARSPPLAAGAGRAGPGAGRTRRGRPAPAPAGRGLGRAGRAGAPVRAAGRRRAVAGRRQRARARRTPRRWPSWTSRPRPTTALLDKALRRPAGDRRRQGRRRAPCSG